MKHNAECLNIIHSKLFDYLSNIILVGGGWSEDF